KAEHDAAPVRRKARRERHAGEIADKAALPGLDVEQIDARIAARERHIGDLLRGRRKARCKDEVLAARQMAHAVPVLIHDREALDAFFLRPALLDEHDAGVEIALFAGDAL